MTTITDIFYANIRKAIKNFIETELKDSILKSMDNIYNTENYHEIFKLMKESNEDPTNSILQRIDNLENTLKKMMMYIYSKEDSDEDSSIEERESGKIDITIKETNNINEPNIEELEKKFNEESSINDENNNEQVNTKLNDYEEKGEDEEEEEEKEGDKTDDEDEDDNDDEDDDEELEVEEFTHNGTRYYLVGSKEDGQVYSVGDDENIGELQGSYQLFINY